MTVAEVCDVFGVLWVCGSWVEVVWFPGVVVCGVCECVVDWLVADPAWFVVCCALLAELWPDFCAPSSACLSVACHVGAPALFVPLVVPRVVSLFVSVFVLVCGGCRCRAACVCSLGGCRCLRVGRGGGSKGVEVVYRPGCVGVVYVWGACTRWC